MIMSAVLASLLATASPNAEAAGVPVRVAGRAPAAVRADLWSASRSVCQTSQAPTVDAYGLEDCVSATYDAAMTQARRIMRAEPPRMQSALLAGR